jgi:hypothetical protein
MTIKKLPLLLAIALLPTVAFAAGPAKAGKWEVTSQTEMTGMPTKMPPHTSTYCLTKEEAENPEKLAPEQQRRNGDCKRTDFKVDGHTVTWKVTCEKSGTKGEGHVTYSSESYTGAMHIAMPNGGEVNVKMSGKYLGACDK